MTIRSAEFDDIYFSPDDGAAETEYVFLRGNNLPQNWIGRDYFTICETGFGTGLNFLVAWDMFEKTAAPQQHLHFISFEKYPLAPDVIKDALTPWAERFGDKIDQMLNQYPLRINGWHRLAITPNISITLIFDDLNNAIPQLDTPIDAWFLDGFAPSKNPDMWSENLFSAMRRCAHQHTTAATFTAAGFVKRGIAEHGFTVSKDKGFGRKRDMLTATFSADEAAPKQPLTAKSTSKKIAVLGGGLGGTAAAYFLAKSGYDVTLFEQENTLASKASGNPRGLYNPRFRKEYDTESIFYSSAYNAAYKLFKELGDEIDFTPCGTMHLINDEKKQIRLPVTRVTWNWHDDHMRIIPKTESTHICGIELDCDSLFLPDGGFVSPHKLCHKLAQNIEVVHGYKDIDYNAYDAVIFAVGANFMDFPELEGIDLHTIRGQITSVKAANNSTIKTLLCYGGYSTPACDGEITCGSTFQRWRKDTDIDPKDNRDNINLLNALLPPEQHIQEDQITGGRTSLRTASQDLFPVVGHLKDNMYCSIGHGSHGLLSSVMGGLVLNDLISLNGQTPLPQNMLNKLAPARYLKAKA